MYCPKCGKEINNDTLICTGCGCSVRSTSPSQQPASKELSPVVRVICIILIIIGVLMVIYAVARTI